MSQADLHNCVLLWLVAHSEIPRSICSGVLSQWEQNIMAEFWPPSPPVSHPSLEEEAGGHGGSTGGAQHAGLSPVLRQAGGSTLGGSITGTGTSGPQSWPARLSPQGLGSDGGGLEVEVRSSIGDG